MEKSGGSSEFMQYADLAPIFDTYGLIEYTISFDIKAAKAGNIKVYMQNGSTTKYDIGAYPKNVTTEYTRQYVTITPVLYDKTQTQAFLAFYGGYGTGVIPTVKNVKVEQGNKVTDWTPAPEDMETRMSTAESAITQNANNINLKVSSTDFNGNNLVSMINQTADSVTISAKKINLSGQLTVSDFDSTSQTTINNGNKAHSLS